MKCFHNACKSRGFFGFQHVPAELYCPLHANPDMTNLTRKIKVKISYTKVPTKQIVIYKSKITKRVSYSKKVVALPRIVFFEQSDPKWMEHARSIPLYAYLH